MSDAFLSRCLVLDLETGADHRILKIGAVLPGGETFRRQGRFVLREALAELDRRAEGARFVLGHNLLGHDLRILRAAAPRLALLGKPVVDTLYLSPLAFPKNPYHALVKDYKLVRESLNDPVADAKLAAKVFTDQWKSFAAMPAERLAFYAFCFADGGSGGGDRGGQAAALRAVAGREAMVRGRASSYVATSFAGEICRVALRRLNEDGLEAGAARAALAYAVAWLGVAEAGDSVLPPWVRHRHPETVALLSALRERPCRDADCVYCRETHDPERQLRLFFGFESFRPEPADEDGASLQRAVVERGLGGRPHLAILATGAGKSICYQLPALVRHRRRGLLTIVVSPLQALMKDQVDNLNATIGDARAEALYGLLTPLERGRVLERVRLGDVALLYVAPEQLRNASFRRVASQREIGCWVFDEAHCLSKWGHDFRPDYLYASRFIRELAEQQKLPVPPVACFTATAKLDVRQEIVAHFADVLGQQLEVFESEVDRDELRFRVEPVGAHQKLERVRQLLAEGLTEEAGSAVVYFARRRATTRAAKYLSQSGMPAKAFHGGMKAPEKRDVLDGFVAGEVRVVCATNAFGMGIDKSDVRLVIHADVPGSLENYLQEAGRAGRDRLPSDCVLLFDEEDVETQFRLSASSRISRRDVVEILRALRRARRRENDAVVVTSGDLLRDEEIATELDRDDYQADTKVKTAVAWLERAGFVKRDENETRVFQGKLRIRSLAEAEQKLDQLKPRLRLSASERRRWLAILAALMGAEPDSGLSADELAELPGVGWGEALPDAKETPGQKILRTLHSLAKTGFLSSGIQLTVYVQTRGPQSSTAVYRAVCNLETAMLDLLAEEAPDAADGEWIDLSLRLLNQRLVDSGHRSSPEILRRLLRSLAEDGKGSKSGSLELKYRSRRRYRVRLTREWRSLRELARRRRAVGEVLLEALLAEVPAGASGRVLVSLSTTDLTAALERNLVLRAQLADALAAAERGLLFLHEQKVVHLQNGLAVFRQAMTIRIQPGAKGRRYSRGDFEPLRQHYDERTFQVHVMARYAALGGETIRAALRLVRDYFSLDKTGFVSSHFPGEEDVLRRATRRESYREIVDDLGNPVQIALVSASAEANMLVLAGPGSGKTRVVVHRCAYLLRVERVPARSILVVCFNRNAALELRRRLRALVGDDARGVTVSTYHGLAMRLTGTSFAAISEDGARRRKAPDFDGLIPAAVRLLTSGEELPGLSGDETREQILAGYSHILVDEYQDVNQDQYDLVSAIAGRAEADPDRKLAILAVGDDDQTIYGWSGARIEFIRRFRKDYQAEEHRLIECYRSTAHILAAAGQLITQSRERLKGQETVRVDSARKDDPPGGRWAALDPASGGKVQKIRVGGASTQAVALGERLFHMKHADPTLEWSDVALLGRQHADLDPIRSYLEQQGVPVAWTVKRDRMPPLHRVREIATWLDELQQHRHEPRRASWIEERLATVRGERRDNPWWSLADSLAREWREESDDAEVTVSEAIEFLYEALAERSRETAFGDGVRLSTVHAAKGLEFRAVCMPDGAWGRRDQDSDEEEERRLYYVGMTRARERLLLFERTDLRNPFVAALAGDFLDLREPRTEVRTEVPPDSVADRRHSEVPPDSVADRRYSILALQDFYLSFAGGYGPPAEIHRRLARLEHGDEVELRAQGDYVRLHDASGGVVAALSKDGAARWRERLGAIERARVFAMVRRRADDNEPAYRERLRCDSWEVPVVRVEWRL